jgi:hypothetical protein
MVQTSDGKKVLVSDPFLGFHFKPWTEMEAMGLAESCEDPEDHSSCNLAGQVLEGHTPVIQVFPKREWAQAIVDEDLYEMGPCNTVVTRLLPAEESET